MHLNQKYLFIIRIQWSSIQKQEVAQTTNSDVNVVGVGDILAKELEEGYGISVVHDKTNYSVSYNRCI